MKRWFVIHTHASGEARALFNLRRQGFDAYLPQYRKQRRHARRTETVSAPLFPRYLFVRLDMERERWRSILSTFGVHHVVSHGGRPAPVPDGLVEEIRRHEDEAGIIHPHTLRPFKAGEEVRITTGAFAEQVGRFQDLDDQERVTVLLNLLGREVSVRLPLEAVSTP